MLLFKIPFGRQSQGVPGPSRGQFPERLALTFSAVSLEGICLLPHTFTTRSLSAYCAGRGPAHTPPPSPLVSFSQHNYVTMLAKIVTLGTTLRLFSFTHCIVSPSWCCSRLSSPPSPSKFLSQECDFSIVSQAHPCSVSQL